MADFHARFFLRQERWPNPRPTCTANSTPAGHLGLERFRQQCRKRKGVGARRRPGGSLDTPSTARGQPGRVGGQALVSREGPRKEKKKKGKVRNGISGKTNNEYLSCWKSWLASVESIKNPDAKMMSCSPVDNPDCLNYIFYGHYALPHFRRRAMINATVGKKRYFFCLPPFCFSP